MTAAIPKDADVPSITSATNNNGGDDNSDVSKVDSTSVPSDSGQGNNNPSNDGSVGGPDGSACSVPSKRSKRPIHRRCSNNGDNRSREEHRVDGSNNSSGSSSSGSNNNGDSARCGFRNNYGDVAIDISDPDETKTINTDTMTHTSTMGNASQSAGLRRRSSSRRRNRPSSGVNASGTAAGILKTLRRASWGTSSEGQDTHTENGDRSTTAKSTASTLSAAVDDDAQKKQDRKVCIIRTALMATLLVATTVVATLTHFFVHDAEQSNFEDQYLDSVAKVAEAFQKGIDIKHGTASTFSAVYTSRYGNAAQAARAAEDAKMHGNSNSSSLSQFDSETSQSIWPNATMPDFQEQAAGQLKLANGRALSFNPIITQDVNRLQWEAHAEESAWILGDESLVAPDPSLSWPNNRTVAFGIYSRDDGGNVVYDPGYAPGSRYEDVMVPVWQIAPIETNQKAVMFNLHGEKNRQRALDDMLQYRVPALTAILQLVQDEDLRPSSILFYPVFDEFNYDIPNIDRNVVGSISIVFSWDTLLASILPDYIKGMICVLRSSTDQQYSYSISGDEVTLLGEGDLHDKKYDSLGRTFKANLGMTKELLGEVDYLITYSLVVYPSQEFEDQYVTNRPAIYTTGAVLIFLFTAALFMIYDYLVEDRQQKTARLARQTGNIVDSMFPAAFRERLYKSHRKAPTSRRSSAASSGEFNRRGSEGDGTVQASNVTRYGKPRLDRRSSLAKMNIKEINKFMKNAKNQPSDHIPMPQSPDDDEPIADLFLDTSIMFSDIVGFTKWSSERSPNEVFRLLEYLFWEFDEIAAKLNVFKLGTIGDCYIAVTGIPDPIDDHAIVLSQFAFECREKVRQVCEELEREGLDTKKLDMRFGIHSGAITAGILRGTKSRFELFGDTINTASRMESTGKAGKIQVSEETAELIRLDRKERWLIKREDKIHAKGKGELQTYWIDPQKDSHRVSFSDSVEDIVSETRYPCNQRRSSASSEPYYNHEYGASDVLDEWEEEKVEEFS